MDARLAEIAKYRAVYAKHESYRCHEDRLRPVATALHGLSGSLLDVSCGRGELMSEAMRMGFGPVGGTEAVPALCGGSVVEAQIHALPFADQSWDHVTCIDVLEHLLEADIVPGLLELQRVTRKTLLLAAADYSTQWDGVELHPSARPYHEWQHLFKTTLSGRVDWVGKTSTSEMWRVTYGG
ncbi:MAG: class I SAM-dependent methyltransferase [Ilumatobacteraceae bacterium]